MKGYRTILFNASTLLTMLLGYLVANGDLLNKAFSSPKHAAVAIIVVNLINIVLRYITTGPVGGKE